MTQLPSAVRTTLVVVAGIIWGIVAVVVALAMRRGSFPAPGDVGLPVAIPVVALYAPFVVGIGIESVLGRSAIGLIEVIVVTLIAGTALALALDRSLRAVVALIAR